jgi:hypothetical protein
MLTYKKKNLWNVDKLLPDYTAATSQKTAILICKKDMDKYCHSILNILFLLHYVLNGAGENRENYSSRYPPGS